MTDPRSPREWGDVYDDRIMRAARSGGEVDDPLTEWADVARVTVYLYGRDELEDVAAVVEREFDAQTVALCRFHAEIEDALNILIGNARARTGS